MDCRIASGLLGLLLAGCASAPQSEVPYVHPDARAYEDFVKPNPATEGVKNEIVTLKNAHGTVKVSLVGANVFSYVPAGGEEVLFSMVRQDKLG